ncbi:AAA ATPase midasin [Gonapodya sp. JEL0774]|nr:AAA ATPase midasin [Gonapodya sp. JEL0774]
MSQTFLFDAATPLLLLLEHIRSPTALTADSAGLGMPIRHLVKVGREYRDILLPPGDESPPRHEFPVWYGDFHIEPDDPDDPFPEGAIDDEPDYLNPTSTYTPSYDSFFVPSPHAPDSPTRIDYRIVATLERAAQSGFTTLADRAILLNSLSDLLLNPFLTLPIARLFSPILPDLIARWADRHPGPCANDGVTGVTISTESAPMNTPTHLLQMKTPMSPKRDRAGKSISAPLAAVSRDAMDMEIDEAGSVNGWIGSRDGSTFNESDAVALAICRIGASWPEIFDLALHILPTHLVAYLLPALQPAPYVAPTSHPTSSPYFPSSLHPLLRTLRTTLRLLSLHRSFTLLFLQCPPSSPSMTSPSTALLPLCYHPHRTVRALAIRCQQLMRGWSDGVREAVERRMTAAADGATTELDLHSDATVSDGELRGELERDLISLDAMVESGFSGTLTQGDVGERKVLNGVEYIKVDQWWRENSDQLVERVEYNGRLVGYVDDSFSTWVKKVDIRNHQLSRSVIDNLLTTYIRTISRLPLPASSVVPLHSLPLTPSSLHPSIRVIHTTLLALPSHPRNPRRTEPDGNWVDVEGRENVLEGIAKGLKEGKPVCVTGAAGVGKTRAVEEVAERCGVGGDLLKLPLTASTPSTHLLGTHTTDPHDPSLFTFRPGLLHHCMLHGKWILLEDLHSAAPEVAQMIKAIAERAVPGGKIEIDGRMVEVHRGFRMLATATVGLAVENDCLYGLRVWQRVQVPDFGHGDLETVVRGRHPALGELAGLACKAWEVVESSNGSGSRRATSRDLFKFCKRAEEAIRHVLVGKDVSSEVLGRNDVREAILVEAIDVFCAPLMDSTQRLLRAEALARTCGFAEGTERAKFHGRVPEIAVKPDGNVNVGRVELSGSSKRQPGSERGISARFAVTPSTARSMEQIAVAVHFGEPVLLVGETGAGKTTAVQALAQMCGHRLGVVNLSQQAEASDLLGGYKPVDLRALAVRARERFEELFELTFPVIGNENFLKILGKAIQDKEWKKLIKGLRTGVEMASRVMAKHFEKVGTAGNETVKKKKASAELDSGDKTSKTVKEWKDLERQWNAFATQLGILEGQVQATKNNLLFSFIEGTLPLAIQRGDWILLDEINLASAETLEALSTLLQSASESVLLADRGDTEPITRHPDFRLFSCMNPANDVGKKDLPSSLRSRFTELFVEPPDGNFEDLKLISSRYLSELLVSAADTAITTDVSRFYSDCKALAVQDRIYDGSGHRLTFTLRTLTRMLVFAVQISGTYGLRRALWEGAVMLFMTQLDEGSRIMVEKLAIERLLSGIRNPRSFVEQIPRSPPGPENLYERFRSFWLERGDQPFTKNATSHYVITPSVERNLENLARAVLCKRFPVLIQGPTSSGKTSMIEFLAKRTGHKFVRVNNHEHTDLQEYIGSYISDDLGRLYFQEGVLVEALRKGYWIVLDELNLAPSDVLEALNRLLDDNRELLIPETGEIVRPHPRFMLFATQNPPGLYGGRKVLSRAFRNRFLELHFDDIPQDELEEILHRRCRIAPSYAKRLVHVYKELQIRRANTKLFEGRHGFITLRDLFRWAGRNSNSYEELAENGYMILAERARKEEEKAIVKEVIEMAMKVKIDESKLYSCDRLPIWAAIERYRDSPEPPPSSLEYRSWALVRSVVWTKAMRRLLTLVDKCLNQNEPVLLVGETGCGKTTICDVIAAVSGRQLVAVNCQQHTETSDFLGGQRPMREREKLGEDLRVQLCQFLEENVELRQRANLSGNCVEILSSMPLTGVMEIADKIIAPLKRSHDLTTNGNAEILHLERMVGRCRSLFEWQDGPLIVSMKFGKYFLLDEISLAEDAVLERLNSVLEPSRTIVLAEKGGKETEEIVGSAGFQFLATMNPGGDFGKKELSPALRNRFTEIWVPQIDDMDDLRLIILEKLEFGSIAQRRQIGDALLNFVAWFGNTVRVPMSSVVSLRDLLSWVQFLNIMNIKIGSMTAFEHGGRMVLLDGMSMNPMLGHLGSKKQVDMVKETCLSQLSKVATELFAEPGSDAVPQLTQNVHGHATRTENAFLVSPFSVELGPNTPREPTFVFNAPTTCRNAQRVFRGMQLHKPILLEGSPGVGKTSLIANLASATGNNLVRINLSDQTDLMDLFGSDLPVEGGKPGQFAWRDGPFLRAMQDGDWVLLDELNLASQSVLEGLNACLDYRATVYITELDRTFKCSPRFRVFAAQNPQQQGGGRKGLPKSFVNRFSQVYIDTLTLEDIMMICSTLYPDISEDVLKQMVLFNNAVHEKTVVEMEFARSGSPWEFNLRDILRWLELCRRNTTSNVSPWDFVDAIYIHRMRTQEDRQEMRKLLEAFQGFRERVTTSNNTFELTPFALKAGLTVLPRHKAVQLDSSPFLHVDLDVPAACVPEFHTMMTCVQMNWMSILVGKSGSGKTTLVHLLASVTGNELKEYSMNSSVDTMELLGGFEQVDIARHKQIIVDQIDRILEDSIASSFVASGVNAVPELMNVLTKWSKLKGSFRRSSSQNSDSKAQEPSYSVEMVQFVDLLVDLVGSFRLSASHRQTLESLNKRVSQIADLHKDDSRGVFEWADGALVQAVEKGEWILLDNANLCSAAVLDRLNPLLEDHGVLTMTERGFVGSGQVKVITPHPNFRMFLTADPNNGGEISRAMRNRGIEVTLLDDASMSLNEAELRLTGKERVKVGKWPITSSTLSMVGDSEPTIAALDAAYLMHRLCIESPQSPTTNFDAFNFGGLIVAEHPTEGGWSVRYEMTILTLSALRSRRVYRARDLWRYAILANAQAAMTQNPMRTPREVMQLQEISLKMAVSKYQESEICSSALFRKNSNLSMVQYSFAHAIGQMRDQQLPHRVVIQFWTLLKELRELVSTNLSLSPEAASDIWNYREMFREMSVRKLLDLDEVVVATRNMKKLINQGVVSQIVIDIINSQSTMLGTDLLDVIGLVWTQSVARVIKDSRNRELWNRVTLASSMPPQKNPNKAIVDQNCIRREDPVTDIIGVAKAFLHIKDVWLALEEYVFLGRLLVGSRSDLENMSTLLDLGLSSSRSPVDLSVYQELIWENGLLKNLGLPRLREAALALQDGLEQIQISLSTIGPRRLVHRGIAWANLGRAYLFSFRPAVPVDPAAETIVRHRLSRGKLARLEDEKVIRDFIIKALPAFRDRTNISRYESHIRDVHQSVEETGASLPLRPTVSQMPDICTDMQNLEIELLGENGPLSTLLGDFLLSMDQSSVDSREYLLQQNLWSHASRLREKYPLYSDLTNILEQAILWIKHGLRLARIGSAAQRQPTASRRFAIGNLLAYPVIDSSRRKHVADILGLIANTPDIEGQDQHVQAKLKRNVSMGVLLQFSVWHSIYSETVRSLCDLHKECTYIFDLMTDVWLEQEQTRAEEEAKLQEQFKYRAREEKIPNDLEQQEVLVAQLLPTHWDSEELTLTTLDDGLFDVGPLEGTREPTASSSQPDVIRREDAFRVMKAHHRLFGVPGGASIGTTDLTTWSEESFILLYEAAISLVQPSRHEQTRWDDDRTVGAHLLGSFLVEQTLLGDRSPHAGEYIEGKPIDFYHDSDIREVKMILEPLKALRAKIQPLLESWPEHPALVDIETIVRRIENFPVQSPVSKFLTGVELLLQKCNVWEETTSRLYSIRECIDSLTHLIVRWRKLELHSWQDLFLLQKHKSACSASRLWFHLYRTLISGFTSPHVERSAMDLQSIFSLLDEFCMGSPVGEFGTRIEMLLSFSNHLSHLLRFDKRLRGDQTLKSVFSIVYNVLHHYRQFEVAIDDSLKERRIPIEKEMREFVKVASWKDVNSYALMESAMRSHRQLAKFIKRYSEVLGSPVSTFLKTILKCDQMAKWSSGGNRQLDRIRELFDKVIYVSRTEPEGFASKRVLKLTDLFVTARSHLERVRSDGSDIKYYVDCLHELAFKIESRHDGPHQQSLHWAKSQKSLRKKLLSDVERSLRDAGLSVREQSTFKLVRDTFKVFSQEAAPFHSREMLWRAICTSGISQDLSAIWDDLDAQYFRTFVFLTQARARAHEAHKDISPPDIHRLLSLGEHTTLLMMRGRERIVQLASKVALIYGYFVRISDLGLDPATPLVDGSIADVALELSKALSDFANGLKQSKHLWAMEESLPTESLIFGEFETLLVSLDTASESCVLLERSVFDTQYQREPFASGRARDLLVELQNTLEFHINGLEQMSSRIPSRVWGLVAPVVVVARAALQKSLNLQSGNSATITETEETIESLAENVAGVVERQREYIMLTIQDILAADWIQRDFTIKTTNTEGIVVSNLISVTDLDHLCDDLVHRLSVSRMTSTIEHVRACISTFQNKTACMSKEESVMAWRHLSKRLSVESVWVKHYSSLVHQVVGTLLSVHSNIVHLGVHLLNLINKLFRNGFGIPEIEDNPESDTDPPSKQAEGMGLGEGDGQKDISGQIEEDEDLEDAMRPEDRQKAQQEDAVDKKEKKSDAIEVDEDFDGDYEDIEGEDERSCSDAGSKTEEPELDERFDKLDPKLSDVVDERLWDEETPASEDEKMEDDSTVMGGQKNANELVADTETRKNQSEPERQYDNAETGEDGDGSQGEDPGEGSVEEENSQLGEDNLINDDAPAQHEESHGVEVREQDDTNEFDLPDDMQLDNGGENTDDNVPDTEISEEVSHDLDQTLDPPDVPEEEKLEAQDPSAEPSQEQDRLSEQTNIPVPTDRGEKLQEGAEGGAGASKIPEKPSRETTLNSEIARTADSLNDQKREDPDMMDSDKPMAESVQNKNADQRTDDSKAAHSSMRDPNNGNTTNSRVDEHRDVVNDVNPNRDLGNAIENWHRRLKELVRKSETALNDMSKLPENVSTDLRNDSTFEFVEKEEDGAEYDTQVIAGATAEQALQSAQKNFGDAVDDTATADDMDVDNSNEESDKMEGDVPGDPRILRESTLEAFDTQNRQRINQAAVDDEIIQEEAKSATGEDATADPDNSDDPRWSVEGKVGKGDGNDEHSDDAVFPTEQGSVEYAEKNYEALRRELEQTIAIWRDQGADEAISLDLWRHYERLTQDVSLALCERLRLILEPTIASKLRGDYKTGKRLNMRKVIPYIASGFKKDKIWLRRTKPNKRAYQVMIAIDDSESMAQSGAGGLAFESLATIAQAMRLLEVGEISVVRFGEDVALLHPFEKPFGTESGAGVLRAMDFKQKKTNTRALLETSLRVMEEARKWSASGSGGSELWQLAIIISDGVCEEHEALRALVQRALDNKVLMVFVVVDRRSERDSIVNMTNVTYVRDKNGNLVLKLDKYVSSFGKAFPYFLVVKDVASLVGTLGNTLQQFFSAVTRE